MSAPAATAPHPGPRRDPLTRGLREALKPFKRLAVRLAPGGKTVIDVFDNVEGILRLREAQHLHRLARGRKTIVEIGSYRGKSCVLLGLGSADAGGVVHAVDPHMPGEDDPGMPFDLRNLEAFRANVRAYGLGPRVREHVMTSAAAAAQWDGSPIDLAWIDGDHSYESAKQDFLLWSKWIRPGGVIAAHDHSRRWATVKRAWAEFLAERPEFVHQGQVKSIVWAKRTGG